MTAPGGPLWVGCVSFWPPLGEDSVTAYSNSNPSVISDHAITTCPRITPAFPALAVTSSLNKVICIILSAYIYIVDCNYCDYSWFWATLLADFQTFFLPPSCASFWFFGRFCFLINFCQTWLRGLHPNFILFRRFCQKILKKKLLVTISCFKVYGLRD